MNIEKLKAPFPIEDISFRPGATTGDKTKCIALAYLNARNVMNRLDKVVGAENWQSKHIVYGDQCICTIGIRFGDEWVWKSDGAGKSDIEGEKGMISDALKRAAVSWGIGRYLYELPTKWVEYDAKKKKIPNPPQLPDWALPGKEDATKGEEDYKNGFDNPLFGKKIVFEDDDTKAIRVLCEKLGRDFKAALTYMVSEKVEPATLRKNLEANLEKRDGS